ncbi:hypothetical protein ACJ41O_003327 [Fusarium nematophilum]
MTADNHFGPHYLGQFDFTILFEQSILSLLPTAAFILLVPFRIAALWNHERVTRFGPILWLKLATILSYVCLQIALITLWCLDPVSRTSIAEAVLGLVESLALAALSYTEHRNSRKPSALISGYLVLTVILDIALTRTLWIRRMPAVASVFTASLALKTTLLVLEETPKPLITGEGVRETASGVINRSFFWWLNPLFFKGSRNLLDVDSLGAINEKFNTDKLSDALEQRWERDPKQSQFSLLKCTFLAYKWQFAAGILPRLLSSAFKFAQPFLIQSVVLLVSSDTEMSLQISSGLIGATVLIYLGLAISSAWHHHLSFQMVTMYRGGLVSLILKKTLRLKTAAIQDSAPVTLMTTDMDTIVGAGAMAHDLWANILELPVGIYLLYRQVGNPSLLILVPSVVTTILSGIISPSMEPAIIQWNQAVQKRVGETSSMLSQIKGIKMMGLTDFFQGLVQRLRVRELEISAKFRWLLVHINGLAMVSSQATPVIIIISAIYWTKADEGLSVAEAFTSLSIISLAIQPLVMILVALMQMAGVVGGCGRIQAFLQLSEQDGLAQERNGQSKEGLPDSEIVHIKDADFETEDAVTLLKGISLTVQQGTLNLVVGRVGCGKSSLLKAIIGELVPSKGRVEATESLGYCDQIPWLRNTSVRGNIVGQSPLDDKWLETVLHSCALDEDMARLPQGDRTIVGSGGVALSGGQKQRVALARAVYSRRKLLILDDVFSSLDNDTAEKVFQRLMGRSGLLRTDVTVVLTTSNVHFLQSADCITMLESGCIVRNQVPYGEAEPSVWGVLEDTSRSQEDEAVPRALNAPDPASASAKAEVDLARQTGDKDCYKIYLQIWLRRWTEHAGGTKDASYAGGYVGFALSGMLLSMFNLDYFLIIAVPKSSNRLHEQLLNSVCRAPLHFFTSTESGSILNRFSQDMTLIDQNLPLAFFLTLDLALRGLVQAGVVASGAKYFGAFLPLSFLTLYLIQKYYLRTSRQMRFLDLEAKSPLYTHFTETIAGLSTVRAFGWSQDFQDEGFQLLSHSQKPFYMMFCIQRWLQVVLDLFVAGMAILLVTLGLRISGATSQGAIGLAMVNLLGFNQTLTIVIDQWTQLETSLGAIARLKGFIKTTPDENKPAEKETPDCWPTEGQIEIDNLTASYSDESLAVLHGVSLVVKPGQKVCICGRSGSGKSSLLLSILRLLELRTGTIRIDGRDIATMPRQYIRSHLATIPQDPVNLSGTVRNNLDPEEIVQADALLVQALKKAGIWAVIERRGGLDADMSELGFSVGQRQLFCLARALLSHCSIVLLDEPTSSVDNATNAEIRQVLREVMDGRTVVEVSHRLDHVTDFDVAVVMGDGRIIEAGDPKELLEKDSALKALRQGL